MSENKLVDLSFEFAKEIVALVDGIKTPKSSYMIDQLARAGTSVGANIHEAQYAHSKCGFYRQACNRAERIERDQLLAKAS